MTARSLILLALHFSSLGAASQTASYQVYALKFASQGNPSPISDWVDNGPKNDSVNIDFMIWLIRGKDGKNILVDAGFFAGTGKRKAV